MQCLSRVRTKGCTNKPAPVSEYAAPNEPWDTDTIDLLQLLFSHQGSPYVLITVDNLLPYVVLVPVCNKSAEVVAKALVTHVTFLFSTPRVFLSDQGDGIQMKL